MIWTLLLPTLIRFVRSLLKESMIPMLLMMGTTSLMIQKIRQEIRGLKRRRGMRKKFRLDEPTAGLDAGRMFSIC